MQQKIHTFLVFLLVFFAGFFPYMPLAHADFSVHADHHWHCGAMAHTESTSTKHSMGECLNLIHEVHFSLFEFSEIFLTVALFLVFLFWEKQNAKKIPRKIIFRSLSPPRYFIERYMRIVKRTT